MACLLLLDRTHGPGEAASEGRRAFGRVVRFEMDHVGGGLGVVDEKAGVGVEVFSGGGAFAILPGLLLIGIPMGLAQGVESTAFAAIAIIAGRVSEVS